MKRACACLLLSTIPLLTRAEPAVADFARLNEFQQVTISPKGDYIAAVVPSDDQTALVVLRLADHKPISKFVPGMGKGVYRYSWVGPQRIVLEPAIQDGLLGEPQRTGELIGIDADGGASDYLFGYNPPSDMGSNIHKHQVQSSGSGYATVIDPLPDDPGHAIVSVNNWGLDQDTQRTVAYTIDVHDGTLDRRVESPMLGFSDFLADPSGAVRYAVGIDPHQQLLTYFRQGGKEDWTPLNVGEMKNAYIEPLLFSRDGGKVYLDSDEGKERDCLIEHDLAKNERHALSCDDQADLAEVFFSPTRVPLAAIYQSGYPKISLLDSEDPMRDKLDAFIGNFPGKMVAPVSATRDGSKLIMLVYTDRDPGTYYLYDTVAMKVDALLRVRHGIDPAQMGERRPVAFKARDGQLIRGYLTLPPGKEPKNLPLVVNPHGGPFVHGDRWAWDAEPQLLATRGYAVLQVNYRGTKGYGTSFEVAGHKSWDTAMIDDITDGAKWVVAQGIADPARMCVYGVSYGGYAALESAVREPDLYRCVIDFAGIYNLKSWSTQADFSTTAAGKAYLQDFVGATPDRLYQASPASRIDKLKARVMIVHGAEDKRVPLSQAKELRQALEAAHHPYEWLVKPGEGHGFYLPENREDFYKQLLAFLDKNIGAKAASAGDKPEGTAP